MSYWFRETASSGHVLDWKVKSTLYSGSSSYQTIDVVETEDFGTALILDDIMQTTTGDEFIYHEMMSKVPLAAHPNPERVLIIGGGDCGLAATVLQDRRVESVTMVEIDEAVVTLAKEYFPNHTRSCNDPRLHIVYEDGAKYLRELPTGQFDVILVDSTDPDTDNGQFLYTREFHQSVLHALKKPGIYVQQSGNPFYNPEVVEDCSTSVSAVFPVCQVYWTTIPTYPGVLFTFTAGSTGLDVSQVVHKPEDPDCRWYTPELHQAAFVLPKSVSQVVAKSMQTSSL